MEYLQAAASAQEVLQRNISSVVYTPAVIKSVRPSVETGIDIEAIVTEVDESTQGQEALNKSLEKGSNHAGKLGSMIQNIAKKYFSLEGAKKAMDLSDVLSRSASRLENMNREMQTTDDLKKKIFSASQNSGGDYLNMADAVSKMGVSAPEMFQSNDEIIAFNEQLNKQYAISGTSPEAATSVTSQITEALGADQMGGDMLLSVLEQAPSLVETIADYMGVPVNKMEELAQAGQITGGMIKEALFSAADSTNAKFETLPLTFDQIWAGIQNQGFLIFDSLMEKVIAIANSDAFGQLAEGFMTGISIVAEIIETIFGIAAEVGGVIYENWSVIGPVILGVAAAMGVYLGCLAMVKGMAIINKGLDMAGSVAKLIHAHATGKLTKETVRETAEQTKLNAAFLACPLTWIVLGIIAVIAVIYSLVALYNKWTDSSVSATGIISGVFASLGAFIANMFIGLWNIIATLANFIANVFTNPAATVKSLILNMAESVLENILRIASGVENLINKIPGIEVSITGKIQSLYENVKAASEEVDSGTEWVEVMEIKGIIDPGSAYKKGYNFGKGLGDKVSNFSLNDALGTGMGNSFDLSKFSSDKSVDYENLKTRLRTSQIANGSSDLLSGMPQTAGTDFGGLSSIQPAQRGTEELLGEIADDTSSIKDSVTVTNEEITYLREIAEKEAINRFTTAEIKINMNNTNHIRSNMDIDGITNKLTENLYSAMKTAREGA